MICSLNKAKRRDLRILQCLVVSVQCMSGSYTEQCY